jgi:GntR family transcriptional regulator/MocR family aminotransferase
MTDSPVNTLLKASTLINQVPALLYTNSQQIINAIQRSYLAGGSLYPEPESLANYTCNTAVAVYDELASQGWVEIIANKGTFIAVPEQRTTTIKARSNRIGDISNFAETWISLSSLFSFIINTRIFRMN